MADEPNSTPEVTYKYDTQKNRFAKDHHEMITLTAGKTELVIKKKFDRPLSVVYVLDAPLPDVKPFTERELSIPKNNQGKFTLKPNILNKNEPESYVASLKGLKFYLVADGESYTEPPPEERHEPWHVDGEF